MKHQNVTVGQLVRSRILLRALVPVLFWAGVHGTGLAQGSGQLASLSEKKLYGEAERALARGQKERAYEALGLALEKRNSGRNKPRPHKKYTPLQLQLGRDLSDREAALGLEACNAMDLGACEEKLQSAQEFSSTERVLELESLLQDKHSTLKGRFSAAVAMADMGSAEEALQQLRSLDPYSAYLPALDDQILRIEQACADTLIRDGLRLLDFKNWGSAEDLLQRAAELHRDDSRIAAAQNRVERGRQAYELAARAEGEATEEAFEAAMSTILRAIEGYPEGRDLEAIKERIANQWVDHLGSKVEFFSRNRDSFDDARNTVNTLDRIRSLNPEHPLLLARQRDAAERLGSCSLQKAMTLTEFGDPTFIGTAFLLLLSAQSRLGPAIVLPSQVKDAGSLFNRKRASQLVLSVEDLTGTPRTFVDAVSARLQHRAESLGLPDLRIRTKQSYQGSPDEDPEFQDFRPDGKSPTALLTVGIRKHLSERWSSETPERVPSKFISGTEEVLNPEYEAKRLELEEIISRMESTKDDKRIASLTRQKDLAEMVLAKISRTKQVPKLADYTYLRINHRQQTRVELLLTLRDFYTKSRIESQEIVFSEVKEDSQLEGVRESDTFLIRNEPVRLPSPQQMLARAQREVLDSLEDKMKESLPAHIHRFYHEGMHLYEGGRRAEAVELFVCHWAFLRGRIPETQREVVFAVVKEETGFDLVRDGQTFLSALDRVAPIAW